MGAQTLPRWGQGFRQMIETSWRRQQSTLRAPQRCPKCLKTGAHPIWAYLNEVDGQWTGKGKFLCLNPGCRHVYLWKKRRQA